jgi:protein involved in polysaccharide export with SLBB domain
MRLKRTLFIGWLAFEWATIVFAQGAENPLTPLNTVSSPPPAILSSSATGTSGSYSAAGTVAYTNSMAALDNKRTLTIGDHVSFRIVEDQKPPVELVVTDSGEMEVPLIGRVPAAGKTCLALAMAIKKELEKGYFYHCTVIIGLDAISTESRGTVYLTGNVRSQGAFDLPPRQEVTVSQAILRAGGFADFANPRKVKLIRRISPTESKTIIVDVTKVLNKGKIAEDPVLRPDDVIMVPEKLINF